VSEVEGANAKRSTLLSWLDFVCTRFLKNKGHGNCLYHERYQRIIVLLDLSNLELHVHGACVLANPVSHIGGVHTRYCVEGPATGLAIATQAKQDDAAARVGDCDDILDQFAPVCSTSRLEALLELDVFRLPRRLQSLIEEILHKCPALVQDQSSATQAGSAHVSFLASSKRNFMVRPHCSVK
jgi:hypothetical protein